MQVTSITHFIEILDYIYGDSIKYVVSHVNFLNTDHFKAALVANNVQPVTPKFQAAQSWDIPLFNSPIAEFITGDEQIFDTAIGHVKYGSNVLFVIDAQSTINPLLIPHFKTITLKKLLSESQSGYKFTASPELFDKILRDPFIEKFKKSKSTRKFNAGLVLSSSDIAYFKSQLEAEDYARFLAHFKMENFEQNGNTQQLIDDIYQQLFDYAIQAPKKRKSYLNRFLVQLNNNISVPLTSTILSPIFTEDEIATLAKSLNSIFNETNTQNPFDTIMDNYEKPPFLYFIWHDSYFSNIPTSMKKVVNQNARIIMQVAAKIISYEILFVESPIPKITAYRIAPINKAELVSEYHLMKTVASIVANMINSASYLENFKSSSNNYSQVDYLVKLEQSTNAEREMREDVKNKTVLEKPNTINKF